MKNKHDQFESEMSEAYEKGELISTNPSKAEIEKFRSAAQITFIKDRRVNIRLTSPDFMDIQARALEEGIPYQTLIASVLHKFVAGRLVEKSSRITSRTTGRAKKLRAS
jgi:predicted DNA binding CopG/RHH family protein